ncbi:MAG: protein translocase subunit SecD, partial [Candidatus Margulisiibacteriota bacterium]
KAGALPVPIEIVSEQFVGPTLGKDSIEDTKRAGLLGFVAVAAFMVVLYRLPGLLASLALALYILLTLAVLKLFHATLTLPGIAGIILTIGIAVDANVIIFERIKDEIRNGLTPAAAITAGFSRALVTILDSNVTTLLASGVLILFGTGSIKGFAITLSIGIFVSMFTAVFVTRMLVDFLAPRFPGKLFHVRSTQ